MDWQTRVDDLWDAFDSTEPGTFIPRMQQLTSERPPGDAIARFELAAAQDSTGHADLAVPLYRAALAAGLTGERRRRATIQLASSLRSIGELDEALATIGPEAARESSDLDDAVRAVHALVLSSLGRDREGLSLVLEALARHLPRYQRSMGNYARALVSTGQATGDV